MRKVFLLFLFILPQVFLSQSPTVGLIQYNQGNLDSGYVLFAPVRLDTTYLIDKCGNKVHQWPSANTPGLSVYLLPDGSLLRSEAVTNSTFNIAGSVGGKIERIDWNGNVTWSYTYSNANEMQNHDIFPMPNGNILLAVWENITQAQALAAGRDPFLLGASLWSCKIVEIQPVGNNSANIVWEWRLWDHLIQEFDNTKSNYGVVANHPELIHLNFNGNNPPKAKDWIHLNAVEYNQSLDQIVFSSHTLSEIYIIDHSTTTAEAAAHAGGVHGKGGDLLYRWGNPQAYNRGTAADQKLFLQHNPTWIPSGYKDAGKIMIFNNGNGRPGGNASSVDVIATPIDAFGDYSITSGLPYGPASLDWTYMDVVPSNFYSAVMGGAQRLSNGNSLICEATKGNFIEVDSLSNIVWEYVNPISITGPIIQGSATSPMQVFRSVFYPSTYSGITNNTLINSGPMELNPYPSLCSLVAGLPDSKENDIVNVYPNPTNNIFTISLSTDEVKNVELINSIGETVLFSKDSVVNVASLKPGIYLMKINSKQHSQYFKRVVIF